MRLMETVQANIHPLAYVEVGVRLGMGTVIRQFASVVRGAVLGTECVVSDTACVDGAVLEDRCRVGGGARLNPGLVAESDVFFGPNCVICNDAWPRVDKAGFDYREFEARPSVIIEAGASIGAGALILPGVRIGAGAMVGAGEKVTRDVPAGMLWKNGIAVEVEKIPQRMRFAV